MTVAPHAPLTKLLHLLGCALVLFSSAALCAAQPAAALQSGSTYTREIQPQESHLFELTLAADQLVPLTVSAGDLNFAVRFVAPGGDTLAEVEHRRYGALSCQFVARGAGQYKLLLTSLELNTRAREYQLKVAQIRTARRREQEEARAASAFWQAEAARFRWERDDLALAAKQYAAAGLAWRQHGRWAGATTARQRLAEVRFVQADYAGALRAYQEAARFGERAGDSVLTLTQLNNVGYVHVYLGDNEKAAEIFTRVQAQCGKLPAARAAERRRLEAQLQNNLGEVEYARGNLKNALSLFTRADASWQELGERYGVALARLNAGYAYLDSGKVTEAGQEFDRALQLWRELNDWRGEALTLTAHGNLAALLGDRQGAMVAHRQARDIFRRIGDRQGEAVTSNGLGDVFEDMNLKQEAIDNYGIALRLNHEIGNRAFEAVGHYYLGRVYRGLNDYTRALQHYEASLALSRQGGKARMATHALVDIAAIHVAQQRFADALRLYTQCLNFYRQIGDLRRQALVRHGLGELHRANGEPEAAAAQYRLALELFERIQDPQGEAESHYHLGRILQAQGRLQGALAHGGQAIALIESQRASVLSQNWRSAYFASVHSYFELQVDILIQLHRQEPGRGYAALAMQTSERARARSLLELLAETPTELRRDADAALLTRLRQLRQLLSAKAVYQMRALNSGRPEAEVAQIGVEVRQLNDEYNFVQGQIKAQSPAYAGLTEPHILSVAEIQAALKEDEGTVLVEYLLGDERSYVWLVTADSFTAEELPSRRVLETLADEVYRALTAGSQTQGADGFQHAAVEDFCPRATQLSQWLLAPLRRAAGARRVLVVADGRLQYIPFDALPLPGTGVCRLGDDPPSYIPMLTSYEVVHLPSFSSLALLRQLNPSDARAAQGIAVWADPVFESDDPRVTRGPQARAPSLRDEGRNSEPLATEQTKPSLFNEVNLSPSRLLGTQEEADGIMRFAPAGAVVLLTGFAANRESALNRDLLNYRILHFATHGLINPQHPSLSGLLLSTVDERGHFQNGLLQLPDIYGLHLNADLVVLSGCQTGLGEDLSGEGLVGLTQGFLYAGSKSVVVSLWKVEDNTAATLMTSFYQEMLEKGAPPAVALRQAKLKMYRQATLRAPYHWSAFIIQGEFRAPVPTWRRRLRPRSLWAVTAVLAIAAWILYSWVKRA
jgi:CHAT domain-containing protein